MKRKIAFVINPISGGVSKQNIPALIEKKLDHTLYDMEILFTRSATDPAAFSRQLVEKKTDVIVAVGGDGTINQLAGPMMHSGSALGIIPLGSGNGFARHLHIPMDPAAAIGLLNKGVIRTIDTATVNGESFVNVSGVGFDAHVAWKFSTAPRRGFLSYAKITLREFSSYMPAEYEMTVDGKPIRKKAFLVCFANGSQYGNNAYIAPEANLYDGMLDIVFIKNVSLLNMPMIAYEMFRSRFHRSKHVEIIRGRKIQLKRKDQGVVNIDGEPVMMQAGLDIKVNPLSLQVITV